MTRSTSIPVPNQRYKDSHGHTVTVVEVAHYRVTFYREGYQFPCVQPVERFLKEFTEVNQ